MVLPSAVSLGLGILAIPAKGRELCVTLCVVNLGNVSWLRIGKGANADKLIAAIWASKGSALLQGPFRHISVTDLGRQVCLKLIRLGIGLAVSCMNLWVQARALVLIGFICTGKTSAFLDTGSAAVRSCQTFGVDSRSGTRSKLDIVLFKRRI